MREIKFKIFADSKWYDKCLVGNTNDTEDDKWTCPMIWIDDKKEWVNCDNGIVCQYTGLKDKNGVEIYEGDIVKCKLIDQIKKNGKWINVETFEKYEVIYSEDDLGFRFKDQWMSVWKFENCELEVIGNIYENKLKEEGK